MFTLLEIKQQKHSVLISGFEIETSEAAVLWECVTALICYLSVSYSVTAIVILQICYFKVLTKSGHSILKRISLELLILS